MALYVFIWITEPVIICCDTIKDEQHYTLTEFVMTLCRKHGILKNERVTLLSSMDQMVAVQLCLAEKNKQVGKLFRT